MLIGTFFVFSSSPGKQRKKQDHSAVSLHDSTRGARVQAPRQADRPDQQGGLSHRFLLVQRALLALLHVLEDRIDRCPVPVPGRCTPRAHFEVVHPHTAASINGRTLTHALLVCTLTIRFFLFIYLCPHHRHDERKRKAKQ